MLKYQKNNNIPTKKYEKEKKHPNLFYIVLD